MLILSVCNQKGGVGKTTTAVNLATCLADLDVRVLLVDLDPQANASSTLGMGSFDGFSIYEALLGHCSIFEKILPTRFKNLFFVPADLDLAGAEVEVARLDNHLFRLRDTLLPLHGDAPFDLVLIDCPPSLGILMTNAMVAAQQLLIPIQCEYFALEGLSKISSLVGQIKANGTNPNLMIGGIIMTMFDARTNLSAQVLADVRAHFGPVVFNTVIPRSVRFGEAPSFSRTITEYDPGGPGAAAYRALARELVGRHRFAGRAAAAPVHPPARPVPSPRTAAEKNPAGG